MDMETLVEILEVIKSVEERPAKYVLSFVLLTKLLNILCFSWEDVVTQPWSGLDVLRVRKLITRGILPQSSLSKIINSRRKEAISQYTEYPEEFLSTLSFHEGVISDRTSADILTGEKNTKTKDWSLVLLFPHSKADSFISSLKADFGYGIADGPGPFGSDFLLWAMYNDHLDRAITVLESANDDFRYVHYVARLFDLLKIVCL
jgi:hypothetical protein